MRFRRIYWVTEQYDEEGKSEVTGVFTSIPDLIESGIGCRPASQKQTGFRICLCELDSREPPLVRFESPDFNNVEEALSKLVRDAELSHEDVVRLADALNAK